MPHTGQEESEMLIGYARVSTTRQAEEGTSLETQTDHLRAAGAERVIEDGGRSGATTDRPGLRELQAAVRPGDVVLVTRLDRLGRSTKDLLTLIEDWANQGVALKCIDQGLDFSGSAGRFLLTLLGAVAELERSMILERTAAGRAAAKASGKSLGGRVQALDRPRRPQSCRPREGSWALHSAGGRRNGGQPPHPSQDAHPRTRDRRGHRHHHGGGGMTGQVRITAWDRTVARALGVEDGQLVADVSAVLGHTPSAGDVAYARRLWNTDATGVFLRVLEEAYPVPPEGWGLTTHTKKGA